LPRLQTHEQKRKLRTSEAGCDESRTPRFNREVPRIIPGIDSNKDYAGNLLAEHNRKLLTPSEECWLGVVNFAESELGKKVPLSGAHYRGHLGTWVRTFYPQLGDRQETRLVNGVQQPIYVYACHEPAVAAGLTKAVEEFFAHPSPGAALRQAGAFASKKEQVLV
jgi:hypothetical protein